MSNWAAARLLFPATNLFGSNLPFNNFNYSTSMVFVSCCKHIDLPAAIVSRWVVLKRHQHFKHTTPLAHSSAMIRFISLNLSVSNSITAFGASIASIQLRKLHIVIQKGDFSWLLDKQLRKRCLSLDFRCRPATRACWLRAPSSNACSTQPAFSPRASQ